MVRILEPTFLLRSLAGSFVPRSPTLDAEQVIVLLINNVVTAHHERPDILPV